MKDRKRNEKQDKPVGNLLTTSEVALIFNVHVSTIRRWSKSGEIIKAYRTGPRGALGFRRQDVAVAYLDRAIQKYLKSKSV
jgi:excisionase family DNA binding protein